MFHQVCVTFLVLLPAVAGIPPPGRDPGCCKMGGLNVVVLSALVFVNVDISHSL